MNFRFIHIAQVTQGIIFLPARRLTINPITIYQNKIVNIQSNIIIPLLF